MSTQFESKVAIITGTASGIGRARARLGEPDEASFIVTGSVWTVDGGYTAV